MGNEESLVNDLESSIKTIEHIMLINKRRNGRSFLEAETFKKVEDGILDNIHKANAHQLEVLLSGRGYKFQFYHELNNKELLKAEITNRLRENKLKEILC